MAFDPEDGPNDPPEIGLAGLNRYKSCHVRLSGSLGLKAGFFCHIYMPARLIDPSATGPASPISRYVSFESVLNTLHGSPFYAKTDLYFWR
jgi:hypothetical protein